MSLSTRLLTLRSSPLLLKLPPYLSALCILIGTAWLFLLPLDAYSRQTYVSENAILPGQVHTHFGGSEHNVFRAYRQEVWQISHWDEKDRIDALERMIGEVGLKAARQEYSFNIPGVEVKGTNVYGLLRGPRADATEAMVLIAAWRNFDGEVNYSAVALALTLARYFKRWSIWSKDIFLLLPPDSTFGPEAWVSAYHSTSHTVTASRNISALPLRAGALQAAVALDYPVGPWGKRFDKIDIVYDGINGALPNLDLLNTAVSIASGQMGIGCSLHAQSSHSDTYTDRLTTLSRGLVTQAAGHATGPHSAFIPYHVDAITLKTVGDGWHDEMSLGRTTESLFRSVNNLLEHLHQSFFFYVLLNANRFVSIGNYLPAAMLVAVSFTITALALWGESGKSEVKGQVGGKLAGTEQREKREFEVVKEGDDVALVPKVEMDTAERELFLPAVMLLGIHLAGLIPFYLLTYLPASTTSTSLSVIFALTNAAPPFLTLLLQTRQNLLLLQSLSLLLLGAALSTLATLNFSLAFFLGLACSHLSFLRPFPARSWSLATMSEKKWMVFQGVLGFWHIWLSPPLMLTLAAIYAGVPARELARRMTEGWWAQGVYTPLIVWGVWWPAWVVGMVILFGGNVGRRKERQTPR